MPRSKKSQEIQSRKLTQRQKEIIVGTILGDAHVEMYTYIPKNPQPPKASLKIELKQASQQYVDAIYEELKDFCISPPKVKKKVKNGRVTYNYKFSTVFHPEFVYFRNLFYPNGIKIVPQNIGNLLTDVGLAYLFQDDGSRHGSGFRLHTEGFTHSDVDFLAEVFRQKGIDCTVQKQGRPGQPGIYRVIYVTAKGNKALKLLIKQHIVPHFNYKISPS